MTYIIIDKSSDTVFDWANDLEEAREMAEDALNRTDSELYVYEARCISSVQLSPVWSEPEE